MMNILIMHFEPSLKGRTYQKDGTDMSHLEMPDTVLN